MSELVTNYNSPRIYSNAPQDPEVQADSELAYERQQGRIRRLGEFLAQAPNLNDSYAEELEAIEREFREDDLPIAPILVLEADVFDEACSITGEKPEAISGKFMYGYSLVRSTPELRETYGKDYVLAVGFHESAHSTAGKPQPVVTIAKLPLKWESPDSKPSIRVTLETTTSNSFGKHRPPHGALAWDIQGSFLEEGFADLKRVEGLRHLGLYATSSSGGVKTSWPDGSMIVNYVNPDGSSPVINGNSEISLPIGYATCIVPLEGGGISMSYGTPNIAAYGLALLDRHIPGLLGQMKAARRDPALHKEVIKSINALQPGLYPALRKLAYEEQDFVKGLKMIVSAISDSGEPLTVT